MTKKQKHILTGILLWTFLPIFAPAWHIQNMRKKKAAQKSHARRARSEQRSEKQRSQAYYSSRR